MRAVLTAGILAFVVAAAEEKTPKLPPEIQQVMELATAAPPEFTADALLRLVESGNIPKEARKDLISTAFSAASRAQHPVRLVAGPGAALDTRSGFQAGALRLGLDALSLQSRAVDNMLAVDKAAARQLFERLTRPALGVTPCKNPLIPDISTYYDLLVRMALEAYTAQDGEKNSRLAFGQTSIDAIRSTVEIAPAIQFIVAVPWTASQFEIVTGSLIGRMQSLGPDDRSFSWSSGKIELAMASLVARAKQYNAHPERLAEAYRSYLVNSLHAPRCADNIALRARTVSGEALELFGETVRGELAPIAADEMKPGKAEAEPGIENYWQTPESKEIFAQCLALRTGADGRNLTEADRRSREWRRQLNDFLNTLAKWQPASENSEADYYHQRAVVYEALLELAPAGEVRSRILDDYVSFLNSSNVQQQNPVEWYWHIKSTIDRIRGTQPAEAQRVIAALSASGNTVLVLTANLERVAPNHSMFPK